jgi:hypothetical protein
VKYGKYEIKNVKHVKSMSEETDCFSLDLYVDGKKFAHVSNRGHGGCNDTRLYAPFTRADEERVTAEMKSDKFLVDSTYEEFDTAVTTLFSMWSAAKQITSECKKKAMFLQDGDVRILGYQNKAAPDQRLFDHVKSQYPDAIILNNMDIGEAAKLLVTTERANLEAEFGSAMKGP